MLYQPDTRTSFAEVSHKLSSTSGVYVIAEHGEPKAVCLNLPKLRERLAEVTYSEAPHITVSLVEVNGWSNDDITHLVFQDWVNEVAAESYEDWQQHNVNPGGRLPDYGFIEFWFEEWGVTHQKDYSARRLKAMEWQSTVPPPTELTEA